MNIEIQNSVTGTATENAQDVRFRCPHCQKLYRTSSDVFDDVNAEFDCASCSRPFYLTEECNSFGLFATTAENHRVLEACPKCSFLKPYKSDECPSCGVFTSKYLELQKVESPVLFELNQQWQKLVAHFDVDQYHQDFLNKCHHRMALNFAYQKYADLQKAMGFDSLCEKYIHQIELRLEQQLKTPKDKTRTAQLTEAFTLTTTQWVFMGVGSAGMLALIYNKFIPTFPNFNGLVMMLTLLAFGIGLFSNGKTGLKL